MLSTVELISKSDVLYMVRKLRAQTTRFSYLELSRKLLGKNIIKSL